METSARNVFHGKISTIKPGAVNDEIVMTVEGGRSIVASIAKASTERLGLKEGKEAIALIKATFVLLMKDADNYLISTRNQFSGKVSKISKNDLSAEVQIDVPDCPGITAFITLGSLNSLGIKEGDNVTAIVKAMNVIVAVPKK